MPFFVYGNNARTGEVSPRLFSEAVTEADARRHAEEHGMRVTAVVSCRESQRPVDPVVAPVRAHVEMPVPLAQEDSAFRSELQRFTPRAYVTWLLIGANILVFVLMTASGANFAQPGIADLLRWGAEYGPKTAGGQPWRLFTAMFVHIGIAHLSFNMIAFAYVGATVERMIGNVGFLLLYLTAGVGGNLLALYFNPLQVEAGASGAIFGVYGAFLLLLLQQRASIPPHVFLRLRHFVLVFILYNLVNSLRPGISLSAHVGGMVVGFAFGFLLGQPLTRATVARRPIHDLVGAAAAFVLVVGGVAGMHARYPNLDRLQQVLSRFAALQSKTPDAIESAEDRAAHGWLSGAKLDDMIERDLLPAWHGTREQLAALNPVPSMFQPDVTEALRYMERREESWQAVADAWRSGRQSRMMRAREEMISINALDRAVGRRFKGYLSLPSARISKSPLNQKPLP